DTDAGTKSDPSGSVDFSRSGAGTGTFSAASCTLVADANPLTFTSSCSVTYTPTSGSGSHVVRGDYNEASSTTHATSFGTDSILVTERSTSADLSCATPVAIGEPSTCTITITDTDSGLKSDPSGTV